MLAEDQGENHAQYREEGEERHPAVQAIDDMIESYGGQWPPRPSFENWPSSWDAYMRIADDMRRECSERKDAGSFRTWMEDQLDQQVNLPQVMADISSRINTKDPVFRALLAPLSYMANLYRWGTAPPTDTERKRTTLEFPEKIWLPFTTISDFWGLVHRSNTFGMNVCNCIYDEEDPDLPVDMRFYFNYNHPEVIRTEKNFFISFLHMENTFRPGLLAMRDYLQETERARLDRDYADQVLSRRVELIYEIRSALIKVSKVFTTYLKDHMVSVSKWADYVQSLPAWNINGNSGGASGGESLTFHALDEFLGTHGEGTIFKGGISKREGIPTQYNKVLDMLREHGLEYRFQSFLGHDTKLDPILKARDDLIHSLYTWRLGHSKIAPRYLIPSRMTSGGNVDRVIETGETLATRGERELRLRARETIAHIKTRPPPSTARINPVYERDEGQAKGANECGALQVHWAPTSYLQWAAQLVKHPIERLLVPFMTSTHKFYLGEK